MLRRILALLPLLVLSLPAGAHDPSAWGGTYRTRDFGRSWLAADAGLFIGASLDVAVSPTDPHHLLYATDTRLLRSRNGGRNWTQEAPDIFYGPTLAVTFLDDGKGALASTAAGVFRTEDGMSWQSAAIAQSALPVRRIVTATTSGRVIALGARGVFVSTDHGRNFRRVAADLLPDQPVSSIAIQHAPHESMWIVAGGEVWTSSDANDWTTRMAGLPRGRIETVLADGATPRRIWAAGNDRVFVSDDDGGIWRAVGSPLPEPGTVIRDMALDSAARVILLASHRGLLRSLDGGDTWELAEGGTLPVHLEAGPLRPDPHEAQTWYIGFSLMPYQELWRRAEQGSNLLTQLDPLSLAGLIAFPLLLLLAGTLLARYLLARQQGRHAATS